MGCTPSKIEDEKTVSRCIERKQHMQQAVSSLNAFAAAHSLYGNALKNTGAALSGYGKLQFPSTSNLSPATPPSRPLSDGESSPSPPMEKVRGPRSGFRSVNMFIELDDCFLEASQSSHEVPKLLEDNGLHYHSNFAEKRGHSARVMHAIRSFRGFLDTNDGVDHFESEEHDSHSIVLDKMLAWEEKLFHEVKAGERMKVEYQKEVGLLNKLKKHDAKTDSLERAKTAVSHLHTRYVIDMQSIDSTVSEINRLRDQQLYPKLVELVDGMATMWETMQIHHQSQATIVQQGSWSLDSPQCPTETSEYVHEHTVQLRDFVQKWHSQFEKLMTQQKRCIKELKSWLTINLIPIDNSSKEKVSSPQRPQNPPIQFLVYAWHDHLEKLPEEHARTAILNFWAVVNTILEYQLEEMKMRDKYEETRNKLVRKTQKFEDWYRKLVQQRTPKDVDPDKDHFVDLVEELVKLQKRMEEKEEAYLRIRVQMIRDKSLRSLNTGLLELFVAMSEFAQACSEMYKNLRVST